MLSPLDPHNLLPQSCLLSMRRHGTDTVQDRASDFQARRITMVLPAAHKNQISLLRGTTRLAIHAASAPSVRSQVPVADSLTMPGQARPGQGIPRNH